VIGNDYFDVRPVFATSGTKYEAVADSGTTLWDKGRRATLTVRGKSYPECVWVSASE
jgi:membrane-bound inhibitor of C-type lysozyme